MKDCFNKGDFYLNKCRHMLSQMESGLNNETVFVDDDILTKFIKCEDNMISFEDYVRYLEKLEYKTVYPFKR